jgi:hypothetical protein
MATVDRWRRRSFNCRAIPTLFLCLPGNLVLLAWLQQSVCNADWAFGRRARGIGWDRLEKAGDPIFRRLAGTLLVLMIVYQIALVTLVMPMFADRFGASRSDGIRIGQVIRAEPAPAFCTSIDTNQLFYAGIRLECLPYGDATTLTVPAWLVAPRVSLAVVALLRPDLDLQVVLETNSGPKLVVARVTEKAR